MADRQLHVVTGAFGYSGQHVARVLLEAGHRVRTLTGSPNRRNPFGGAVEARPYDFDRPERLVESLRGARAFYNTYWVRFDHAGFSHAAAVENTRRLFGAARAAGVGRVVHVSVTNPSEDSPLPYFRGKALQERALRESGLPCSILRPALFFGGSDVLLNNIAWTLRRLPVFGVFGDGRYRVRPIFVEDFARLALREGAAEGDRVVEAVGPETFAYRELVETVAAALGVRRAIVSVPPWLGLAAGRVLGCIAGDVMITGGEIECLMAGLLFVDAPPTGETRLTEWARANAATLGVRYASELARRRDRERAYADL